MLLHFSAQNEERNIFARSSTHAYYYHFCHTHNLQQRKRKSCQPESKCWYKWILTNKESFCCHIFIKSHRNLSVKYAEKHVYLSFCHAQIDPAKTGDGIFQSGLHYIRKESNNSQNFLFWKGISSKYLNHIQHRIFS